MNDKQKSIRLMTHNPDPKGTTWQTFAGGTGAHHGNSYSWRIGNGNSMFSINPPQRRGGSYNLQSFNVTASHWVNHGNFSSPQAAKSAAARILQDASTGRVLRDVPQVLKNPRRKLSQGEMLATVRKNPASTEAHELFLFITNDADLYRQQTQPIILNLRKKIKRGIYNPELAVKLWRYLADSGAKKYNKEHHPEFFDAVRGFGIFTVPIRNEVARELAAHYSSEVNVNVNENPTTIRATGKYKPRNRASFDTGGKRAGNFLHVQQQRGAMWFTLAVSKNTEQGRKLARLWAERHHRKHPGTKLRLFV